MGMERKQVLRILIVDDNAFVREGLAAIIGRQSDMEVVGEAGNGAEAVTLYCRHQPDVTLMDLRMPIMDGIAATHAIRKEFPEARILVVTTFVEDESITSALHAGAAGYVLKDAPMAQIMEAIRATGGQAEPVVPPQS